MAGCASLTWPLELASTARTWADEYGPASSAGTAGARTLTLTLASLRTCLRFLSALACDDHVACLQTGKHDGVVAVAATQLNPRERGLPILHDEHRPRRPHATAGLRLG